MDKLSNNIVEFYELLSSWEHEVIKGTNLSLQQMHTIEVLGTNQPIRMKDLAEKLGVSMGTLTVMIHRLENLKLVKRVKNPKDGRSFFLNLTKKGSKHYLEHHNHHLTLAQELIADFTEKEQSQFNYLLEKLLATF